MKRVLFAVIAAAIVGCGGSSNPGPTDGGSGGSMDGGVAVTPTGGTPTIDAGTPDAGATVTNTNTNTNTNGPTQPQVPAPQPQPQPQPQPSGGGNPPPTVIVNVPPNQPPPPIINQNQNTNTTNTTTTTTVPPAAPPQPPGSPCSPGTDSCGTTACFDLQNDYFNCGACGHVCGAGDVCSTARCLNICPADKSWWCANDPAHPQYGVTGTGVCSNLYTDAAHCGACGNTCGADHICKNGACEAAPPPTCATGQTACGSTCVDLDTDARNCGACAQSCAAGLVCTSGACTPACATGQTYCAASTYTSRPPGCYDLMNTWNACGACDNPCRQSWDGSSHQPGYCDKGVCAKSPPTCSNPGLTWCSASVTYPGRREPNGACVDVMTDIQNCGRCDNTCSGSEICTNGACGTPTPTCPTGQTWCGFNQWSGSVSGCVDLLTATADCGTCGTLCRTPSHGVGQCIAGKCVYPP